MRLSCTHACIEHTRTTSQPSMLCVGTPVLTVRADIDRVHTVRTEPEQDFPILDCADY